MNQLTTERILTLFWFTLWVTGTIVLYREVSLLLLPLATVLIAASLGFLEGGSVFGVIHWLPHASRVITPFSGALVKTTWTKHWAHHKTADALEGIQGEEAARIRERDRLMPPATWIIIGILHATTAPLVIAFAFHSVAYPFLFCLVYYASVYTWYLKEEEGHGKTHEGSKDWIIRLMFSVVHKMHHTDTSSPWYHLYRPHGMLTLFTGRWFIRAVIWWVDSVEQVWTWADPAFGQWAAAQQAEAKAHLAEDHSYLVRSAPTTSH